MNPEDVKPIQPKHRVKPWEEDDRGQVVENPDLVKLKGLRDLKEGEEPAWKPFEYVSYLWLLVDLDDLRVGIETQVSRETAGRTDASILSKANRQGRAYGHPTLALKRGTHSEDTPRALAGGELLYHAGRWIINRNSGRFGRSGVTNKALMPIVHDLFQRKLNLKVKFMEYKV